MYVRASAVAAALLLLTACAAPRPQAPADGDGGPADTSTITIEGDVSNPVNQTAIQAIADLERYWTAQFPELYDEEYTPIAGGYFAVDPSSAGPAPPCAEDVSEVGGNAYYCSTKDVVAWDAEGLLPELQSKFGDFVIPVVMAHEWGHAVQARSNFTARTVTRELQADCFAGAWARHAQDDNVFDVNAADLDTALAGVLELRDTPGTSKIDPNAHGSGFDRVSAFQDGYDNGVTRCKDYRDDEPMVFELPFSTYEDAASGGDAPYGSVINGVPYDIEDYWTHVYPEVTGGKPWPPLHNIEPFDPDDPPSCGGQSADGYALFYCIPEDYVAWDNVVAMPEVYRQGGDYAVATLLATQWGLAALTRLGDQSDEKTSTLRGDCLAGAYTASVILHNRPDTSSFSISPGDLDEGITALLVFRGDGDVERQGAGWARVKAFREGVINGVDPCLEYRV
ncbi:neutral zinc metallopeptidase [Mycolicibacterium pulveris]|uniref:Lipoprotein peptidase LpqM n=1 Tax=Mycolicibacterium pulveris TaxID=36813 RepID=A0A7I7UDL0_MYCPV|nr:neutral zinc metallopeptidase [Mycolicibacterium pulveris]MCV6980713.1 neutral zinc metallopeptidase [Mycolicibacterium pulveris]BBY79382.1 lipoprotein peptidase LpqM [Mycolicibacterium pulveris]